MLKVKGGYWKLYPILSFIGSSTRNERKDSSVGLELASTFYIFTVDSDTRNKTLLTKVKLRMIYQSA